MKDSHRPVKSLISHGAIINEYTIGNSLKYGLFEEAELMLTLVEKPQTIAPHAFSDYNNYGTVLIYIMANYKQNYEENFETLKRKNKKDQTALDILHETEKHLCLSDMLDNW